MSTLGLPFAQAAEQAVPTPSPVAAGTDDATEPAAPDVSAKPAVKDEPPPPSDFEDVLREQDPAGVPLSLALMGGVLGILYVRRKR